MGEHHSLQTQADSLEISLASQLSVADKPRKIVYNSFKSSEGNLTINDLPDELLLAILSYMSSSELLRVIPGVCSRWETLSRDAELWCHGVCEVRFGLTDEEILRALQMIPQLRTLVVSRCIGPSVFQSLCANCHELTRLDLDSTLKLSNSELKNLFNTCTKIHTLKIPCQLVSGIFVEGALKLSNLRILQLTGNADTDSETWLSALADRCPQLCDLDLEDEYCRIQDMERFLNAKRYTLKRMCVMRVASNEYVVPLLAGCATTLEHLVLYRCHSYHHEEAEAFSGLEKLHNLQVLNIEGLVSYPNNPLPAVFKSGGLSNLKKLQFKGCWCVMEDTIIAVSRGCPELRELTLRYCDQLTDAAFTDIHRLEQLEILSLYSCVPLGGATISYIAKLPALHTLRFSNVRLERLQPGLEHIVDISGLRCLFIQGSSIQHIPFDRFPGRLANLRELHLERCNGDQNILDEMCKRMPRLKVYRKL